MKTTTTLAMIALLSLSAAQVQASTAGFPSGVPMNTASRLLGVSAPALAQVSMEKSGLPMNRAARLLGQPDSDTTAIGSAAAPVLMGALSMHCAKRT